MNILFFLAGDLDFPVEHTALDHQVEHTHNTAILMHTFLSSAFMLHITLTNLW